jgi:hypothetical protein
MFNTLDVSFSVSLKQTFDHKKSRDKHQTFLFKKWLSNTTTHTRHFAIKSKVR